MKKHHDPLGWFAYELGKPSSEWRARHWAAMAFVIGVGSLFVTIAFD
jgi:hypothetical protein